MALFGCGSTRDYLKSFGFGTIALPREGIKPLLMLVRSGGRLTPLGPLASTFRAGATPLPTPVRGRSASVSGARSRATDAGGGLDILGSIIGALAGSALGLKAAYKNARKVEFEFGEVMEEKVDINDLDSFLSNGSIAPQAGNFVRQALEDDEVYVITSTLDALQISVEATKNDSSSLGLQIPVIQQIVGGNVAVSGSGASNSKVTYRSTTQPLSFGLQAVRMIVKQGKVTTLKVETNNLLVGLKAGGQAGQAALVGPGLRIEI
jgi:hypothetical protein